jgi:hypothetical protein
MDWDDQPDETSEPLLTDGQAFDTLDEAVAALLNYMDPDGRIDIHAEDCKGNDGTSKCDCTPLALIKGAEA